MNRATRTDNALAALNDERDHLSVQISLQADAETADAERLALLRHELEQVERRIRSHRPEEA